MIKTKIYTYLGETGTINSSIYIPGISSIVKYQLMADNDKLLTNGKITTKSIIIPERELSDWYEVFAVNTDKIE